MSLYIELIFVAVSIANGCILRTTQLNSVLDYEDRNYWRIYRII
jgi:hypothetical protein